MIEYKLKSISIKSGITALAMVGLVGIVGCDNEKKEEPCTLEEEQSAYNYCKDYTGKDICDSCEDCECRKYSACECHCEYRENSPSSCDPYQ